MIDILFSHLYGSNYKTSNLFYSTSIHKSHKTFRKIWKRFWFWKPKIEAAGQLLKFVKDLVKKIFFENL